MDAARRDSIWIFYPAACGVIDACDSPGTADGFAPGDSFEPGADDEDRCQQSDAIGRDEGRTHRGNWKPTRDRAVSRGSIC